ncbi:nitrate- and nitrite sensing domain-containing protein [Streptomyces albiaxialis]|uniref:histidine kinase n=1 Tax=Streptomyces albiaxialis TaxID=329523 RepID=A0ABN2WSI3_9ACTN
MRFRGKSIRRKIVVLLLVPLVSLVSIWGFATYITGSEAQRLANVDEITNRIGDPSDETVQALQRERRQILIHLADPRGSASREKLRRAQRATDTTVARLRDRAEDGGLRSMLSGDGRARLDELLDGLSGLDQLRSKVADNTITRGGAFQAYNELIDPAFTFFSSQGGLDDVGLERQARALVGVARAREYLSREDALTAAAFVAGRITKGDQRALSDRVAERSMSYQNNLPFLPAEDRQIFDNYWNGTEGRTLRSYEDTLIASGTRGLGTAVTVKRWHSATSTVLTDLDDLAAEAEKRYEDRVEPVADRVLLQAAAAGFLGFLAVLASLIISFRVGRGLVRDLNTLRKEANESAGVRLPSMMRRLASGEQVDVETESPRLDYPPDEMGQVGQALNTLQRAAVEAAVKQADMRRGVSEVFVNLARRNQVLLHRQLTLLDAMERRTEDADELADLFRLDHLTTRMRRHAEGLVILSGAAPSRQWRKPVQLMDVVRAAVAEVEDYERIEVRRLPRLAVDGSAVADLTHLVAELLENATVFSPPHTAVQVLGERVANGFTLEIHDRGLGMAADALLDANLRLAETPEFELSDTDRLGLFVVSRLAQRQGVRVSLQPSPYGGTTAVVLIPGAVLTETPGGGREDEERPGRRTALENGTKGDALPQRSAPRLEKHRENGVGERALGGPVDGPVELEPPLGELDASLDTSLDTSLDAPDSGGRLFRKSPPAPDAPAERPPRTGGPGPRVPQAVPRTPFSRAPAGEQHQQADDEQGPGTRGAEDEEQTGGRTTPLPRRRRNTPVLVSDHGRPVGAAQRDRDRDGSGDEDKDKESRRELPRRKPKQPSKAPGSDGTRDGTHDGTRDEAPGEGAGDAPARPATVGGLPRRVRQASLAPQLKSDRPAPDTASGPPRSEAGAGGTVLDAEEAEREAEAVRSRMSSLQRGWERGRRHNDAGPSGDEAGEPAQGTTPEGDGR